MISTPPAARSAVRLIGRGALAAAMALAACARAERPAALTPAHAAAMADSVRAFLAGVAAGVTRDGPAAWRRFFSDSAAFFMASEGRLVFRSGAEAAREIAGLARVIRDVDLKWGDSVRVDPLAPGLAVVGAAYREVRHDPAGRSVDESGYITGLAEHQADGWRFRDAHWSVVAAPPAVR